jgi:hypothetical protein
MSACIPLDVEPGEATLHQLTDRLVRQIRNQSHNARDLDQVLIALVETIRRILSARFGNEPVTEEAAASVLRTFLRRVREDGLGHLGADEIEQFLVQTALTKAYRIRARIGRKLITDPVDPRPAADELVVSAHGGAAEQREMTRVMSRYFNAVLKRMQPCLKNVRHRRIFRYLLRGSYGGPRLTHREIALEVGCSERTVERVERTFQKRWIPLVEQARREYRELVGRLEGISH